MEIIVDYMINNDGRLRTLRTNENDFNKIRKELKEYHNTDNVKIMFITKERRN